MERTTRALADLNDGAGLVLLGNYQKYIIKATLAPQEFVQPLFIQTGWGEVAFFPFNSVNDPGLMANEGRIGRAQYDQLNAVLADGSRATKIRNAVRVALLHHHPISAPQSQDAALNRAYDWMKDGPLFLQLLNQSDFHFILHGHQHEPFSCRVDYGGGSRHQTQILAAGSATQGEKSTDASSFNVLDLLTPFEARFQRFDYSATGFGRTPTVDQILPVRSLKDVRVDQDDRPESVEDWAMRALVTGTYRGTYDLDAEIEYKEFDYRVEVTSDQLYKGIYRRHGTVVGENGSDGLVYVISGSPANTTPALKLSGLDNLTNTELYPRILFETNNCKVVRVMMPLHMRMGVAFDVTLTFQWQASAEEPNDFDGINLMPFARAIKRLKYCARLPWRPMQARVIAYGIEDSTPDLINEQLVSVSASTTSPEFEYSFEINDPKPMAYLISFRPCR